MSDLSELTVSQLRQRISLGEFFLRLLKGELATEEGADSAYEKYSSQLNQLKAELESRSKPDPVLVQVKAARLGGKHG